MHWNQRKSSENIIELNRSITLKAEQFSTQIRKHRRSTEIQRRRNSYWVPSSDSFPCDPNKTQQRMQVEDNSSELNNSQLGLESQKDCLEVLISKYRKLPELSIQFSTLRQMLQSTDKSVNHYALMVLRKRLSDQRNPLIQETIHEGLLPFVIRFALLQQTDSFNASLRREAVWCLSNMSTGYYHHIQALISHGVLELFVRLLEDDDQDAQGLVLYGIANMAVHAALAEDLRLKGTIVKISNLIQKTTITQIKRSALWALSNICRKSNMSNFNDRQKIIGLFSKALEAEGMLDRETTQDCLRSLALLLSQTETISLEANSSGLIRKVLLLLSTSQESIRLVCLDNLCSLTRLAPCSIIDTLLRQENLRVLTRQLRSENSQIQLASCRLVVYITEILSFEGQQPVGLERILNNQSLVQQMITELEYQDDGTMIRRQLRRLTCRWFSRVLKSGEKARECVSRRNQDIIRGVCGILIESQYTDTLIPCLQIVYLLICHQEAIVVVELQKSGAEISIQKLTYHSNSLVSGLACRILQSSLAIQTQN